MSAAKMPLYLARASYRQRRLRDVIRMLPFVGFLAWILPIMSGLIPATSSVGLYIFAVWVILIIVAAVITRSLSPEGSPDKSDDALT
ncbi:hypothetical protein K3729_08645 [Rhodobacteraceae bacterium S2214]|nr:hypothetical protein K3729_08645 [Rhodobacteraceae bacterium S2214]